MRPWGDGGALSSRFSQHSDPTSITEGVSSSSCSLQRKIHSSLELARGRLYLYIWRKTPDWKVCRNLGVEFCPSYDRNPAVSSTVACCVDRPWVQWKTGFHLKVKLRSRLESYSWCPASEQPSHTAHDIYPIIFTHISFLYFLKSWWFSCISVLRYSGQKLHFTLIPLCLTWSIWFPPKAYLCSCEKKSSWEQMLILHVLINSICRLSGLNFSWYTWEPCRDLVICFCWLTGAGAACYLHPGY